MLENINNLIQLSNIIEEPLIVVDISAVINWSVIPSNRDSVLGGSEIYLFDESCYPEPIGHAQLNGEDHGPNVESLHLSITKAYRRAHTSRQK